MAEDISISVKDVSKAYRIWNSPVGRLLSPAWQTIGNFFPKNSSVAIRFHEKAAGHYRDFWALNNASFDVKKGESVGIIGRNGSGKSTLLQLIAGTLQPTRGTVKVNGRVSALLELGSGFNPEFTGRENVYLNGSVLGLSRTEVDARFDNIAAFADIGDFIDQPVKTYSSGMMIRLAFAVAVSVDPEVLIVDEALSVGDVFFQQKCFKRVHEMLERGVSLLFVSHDTTAVQNLCDRAALLRNGEMIHFGPPEECVSRYYAGNTEGPVHQSSRPTTSLILKDNLLAQARTRHGTRRVELIAARLADPSGTIARQVKMGEYLNLEVLMRANKPIASPACGIHLYDRMNNLIFGAGTPQLKIAMPALQSGEIVRLSMKLRFSVQPGPYTFNLALAEPDPENPNLGNFHDVCEGLGPIEVLAPNEGVWPFYGIAQLDLKMEVHYK